MNDGDLRTSKALAEESMSETFFPIHYKNFIGLPKISKGLLYDLIIKFYGCRFQPKVSGKISS